MSENEVKKEMKKIEGYEMITDRHLELMNELARKVYNTKACVLLKQYLRKAQKSKKKFPFVTLAHLLLVEIFADAIKHGINPPSAKEEYDDDYIYDVYEELLSEISFKLDEIEMECEEHDENI